MIVCLVSTNIQALPMRSWGAIEAQVAYEGRGLVACGHEVHILTVGPSRQTETFTADGVVYHSLGMAAADRSGSHAGGMIADLVRFVARSKRCCQQINPDIVHIHARYPCFLGGLLGSLKPWRTIYHAHNWKQAEKMPYSMWSLRRAAAVVGARIDIQNARRPDHVITTSRFMKTQIIETAGIRADKVSVVANVLDVTTFKPEPVSRDRHQVLFLGRLAQEKGLVTLIEAMAILARQVPKIHLKVVGPDQAGSERGSFAKHCKQMVSDLGLDAHVTFVGEVPNHLLADHIRRTRLLVVPSVWHEPFGVVVLEGLACGTPVVASRVGGIPELIEEGQTGLLVPPADPAALAEAILDGLQNETLAQNAAVSGPETVVNQYSWTAVGQQIDQIYKKIVGASKRGRSQAC